MTFRDLQLPKYENLRMKDFVPSWIGHHPFAPCYLLGSNNGQVAYLEDGSLKLTIGPQLTSQAPINGITITSDYLAVSSPDDITFFALPDPGDTVVYRHVVDEGAHGIIATTPGVFLAPLGDQGIAIITRRNPQEVTFKKQTFDGDPLFYRLAELPSQNGRHYYACACRTDGVGLIDTNSAATDMRLEVAAAFDADIVDVVPFSLPNHPNALVAAGSNGEIFVFHDIINHSPPIPLLFQHENETVYRVFVSHGHLILLTGRAVHVIVDLIDTLTQRHFEAADLEVASIPVEAVDAYLHRGRWFMVVTATGIRKYDLDLIDAKVKYFAPKRKEVVNRTSMKVRNSPLTRHMKPKPPKAPTLKPPLRVGHRSSGMLSYGTVISRHQRFGDVRSVTKKMDTEIVVPNQNFDKPAAGIFAVEFVMKYRKDKTFATK